MNANRHRIIFNRSHGQLMAVAENVSGQGKSPANGTGTAGAPPHGFTLARLRPAAFAALLAVGAQLSLVPLAQAQIVAYKAAPASQHPTVLSAGNGVPLINIQSPSAAGVSRNTYSQFDVDANGVILNNARNNALTQLGGWVQGNPWLARGSARVILNEVVSANPSQLRGYVEVAGSAAQVVIANPAGVTCNGCGFINASRATLTTGTPIVNGGNLESYRVEGGTIRVEGAGLDASRVGYTDLIARAVEVNAGLWAQTLKVTAGANLVDAGNSTATQIAGSGAAPAFAIDVASLGGMYAGKIVLVGTEAGVGVRNAGWIGASAGEVVVTADGRLTNSGSIVSSGPTMIDAAGIANSGTLYAQGDLTLATRGNLDNNSLIAAQGNATLTASGAGSRIVGDAASVFAAGLNADGSLAATGKLTLTASEQVSAHGQQVAGGDLVISARSLDLIDSRNSAQNIGLTASAGELDLSRASSVASGTLSAHTTQTLLHDDARSNAGQLDLTAQHLGNARGEIIQTGSRDTDIALAGDLDNTQGRIASNSLNLSLAAQTLTNTDGTIEHAGNGNLGITATTLTGTRGSIVSNGALALSAGAATLDAGNTLANALDIVAASLSNQGGLITQRGNGEARINVVGTLNNRGGTLTSNGSAKLTAEDLDNRSSGQIVVSSDLDLTTGALANDSGRISAGHKLTALAREVGNAGGLIVAGNDLSLAAASLDNTGGTLGAVAGKLSANIAGPLDNTRGRIEAAQNLTLASDGLSNSDGTVVGNALAIDTRGAALDNRRGILVAAASLDLQSGQLTNHAGLIQANDVLTIDTHGQRLANTGAGSIIGQRSIRIASGDLDNASGLIGARGNLGITGTAIANTAGGRINSEADIALAAASLDNRGGQIEALGGIDVRASGQVNNDASLMRAGRAFNVAADSLSNANTLGSDQGLEGQSLSIAADTINNRSGAMRAATTLVIESSGTLDNRAGLISSAQTLSVRDPNASKALAITNTAGTVIAGTRLDIDSASLSGDGKLLSLGDLAVKLVADYTHSGAFAELTADDSATLETAGTLTNRATLQAGTALALTAATIDNQSTGQIRAPELTLSATDTHTLTNRGLIDGGDTRIDAVTLNNLGSGHIYGNHLSIAATTLNNLAEAGNAPVIAARNRLDLAVGTLNNREGALIFSVGDLAIGGSLDGDNRATGTAGTVNNASAIIEALVDLQLSSSQLNNERSRFATREDVTSSTDVNVVLWDHGGSGNYKLTKNTVIRVTDTVIADNSDPGRILAGSNMALTGTVVNDKSDIMVGGNLSFDLSSYTGIAQQGYTLKSETGTTTLYYRKDCKWYEFCSYKNHRTTTSAYNDGLYVLATYDLAVARLTSNQTISGTATRIDNLNVGAVGQPAPGANGAQADVGNARPVSRITRIDLPGAAGGPGTVVASLSPTGTLPSSSLYHVNPVAGRPLIETDPRFAGYRDWLTSDYMLTQLALNPATTQKRLGDGFYEQRLINEQVAELTGRRFLIGYQNEETQYRALLDAGVTFAQTWNLIPGVALSAEQMAQLTSDLVWLVEKDVTLADGSTQKVLAPQLYARLQAGDLDATGALLAGNTLDLNVTGDLTNMGTLAGRQLVSLSADNIKNLGGRISGEQVSLAARTDLDNIGGAIEAGDLLFATAGRNLSAKSVSESHTGGNAHASLQDTAITRLASLQVSNPGGTMQLEAGGDITLLAAHLLNTAPTAAGNAASRTTLIAHHDIKLETVTESAASGLMLDGNNYRRQGEAHETGTRIEATGNVRLQADRDVTARAASVTSNEGALVVSAGRDILVEAGAASQRSEAAARTTKSGFLSSKTTTARDTQSDTTAIASTFSGDSTTLIADRDIAVKGSNVVATNDTTVIAGRDLKIEAAAESHNETHYSKTKQSGVFSSGGVGFTLGSRMNSTDQQTDATLAAKSTVGSTDGNVLLLAGETYKQVGSDVIAAKGDIDIAAKTVDIVEARQTSRTVTETKSKQSGFTLAFTSPVITAIQTAQQMSEAASDTKDGRMKALAAASTGLAGYNAYSALEAGQGTTIDGKANQVLSGKTNPDGSANTRDANAADKMGGVGINLSLGSSKSQSKTSQTTDTAAVSNLTAGRDIVITAAGAGTDSDITLQGAQATAARNLTLAADDEIKLLAARNTADQHSTNQNSSASVGIGFMVGGTQNGFTIQAGVSGGKGKADGTDRAWSNTQVEAGDTLTLKSGGDATLKGAVAKGEQVKADIGGDLKIESLQDTSTYDSQQKSLGVSVSLCIPPFCVGAASTGSVSASGSKVQSDYASVTEQSGIRAGDGGFDVKVAGDTDLKGGAITSTQQAIDESKNRLSTAILTTSDIANHASASASSSGFNLSSDVLTQGKYGIAKAVSGNALNNTKESDSSSGQTRAVVSAGTVEITDEARQIALAGKTAEQTVARLNREATNAHVAAQRIDHKAMQKQVEAERAIKEQTIKMVSTFTDEAYRSRFQQKPKPLKGECPAGANCNADPSKIIYSYATADDIKNADPASILAVNGILNDEKRAVELGYQNIVPDKMTGEKPNTFYVMHIAPANNALSELLGVAYEKIIASADYGLANFLGYTNGMETYAALLASRGQEATASLGHSRGVLVQEAAFTILANRPGEDGNLYTNPNLTVRGLAGASNAVVYSDKAAAVQGPQGDRSNITYAYFDNDPISVSNFSGGNPGVWTLKDLWQVFATKNSMHSCGGTGAKGCTQVEKPVPGGPQGTPDGNAKLIEYVGGQRKGDIQINQQAGGQQ